MQSLIELSLNKNCMAVAYGNYKYFDCNRLHIGHKEKVAGYRT